MATILKGDVATIKAFGDSYGYGYGDGYGDGEGLIAVNALD